jgi:hypothetical protein
MTMITSPRVGATITTHKGNIGIVEQLEDKRVIVRVPKGILKSVPLSAIARREMPQPTNRPDSTWLYDPMPEVGDRVVIRNLTKFRAYPWNRVAQVDNDGTISLTSDYGDA